MSVKRGTVTDDYGRSYEADLWRPELNGTHISSRLPDGTHLPVLDVDNSSVKVYPSQTPYHFHVYIDRPMSWRQYKKLMKILAKAGVVDDEWRKMTVRRREGVLRVVPPPPKLPQPPRADLPPPKLEDRKQGQQPHHPYDWR